jgi:zinc D-Ala-D-Ala carboxypeptidase
VLSSTLLAAHFTAGELTRDGATLGAFLPAPAMVEHNLRLLAERLEGLRAVLGVPLRITSGYRPPEKNAAVGGAATSSHLDGLAADFVPVGLSPYRAYTMLRTAADGGALPAWDQFIFYPVQGHIHAGYGARLRREIRLSVSRDPGGTPLLTADMVSRLPGYVSGAVDAAVDASKSTKTLFLLLLLLVGAWYLWRD